MQWGDWGPTEYCPSNSYATGFAIRVEYPIDGDDTALNAIQLYCRSGSNNEVGTITSSVQDFGEWTGKRQCRNGRLNAIRMRVEGNQGGNGDDTAANDLDMRCENGEELRGGGTGWGTWSSWQNCPSGQIICGIQTRVEGKQGKGDDTALNDAIFYCC